MTHTLYKHKTSIQISISISDEALIEASLNGKCKCAFHCKKNVFLAHSIYFIRDHEHLELDFLRAVEYVSTHPNANDEIMNLYDSPFAKNAVRYVYSIIRCVTTTVYFTVIYGMLR